MPRNLSSAILILVLAISTPARGAGYAVLEKSARSLGTAYAGETAAAEDASTVYGNPAGMTLLDGAQFASSGFAILPSARFHNRDSRLGDASGGEPLSGDNGGDAGSLALVPAFFLVYPVGTRVRLGFGVFAPCGLTNAYDDDWVGRYGALR